MQVSVDNKPLFELSDTQKKVICNYISSDIFEEDMKRRLHWVLNHLYDQAFIILKKEWVDDLDVKNNCKLHQCGVDSIPTNREKLAELIFSQGEYKCRKMREEQAIVDAQVKSESEAKARQVLQVSDSLPVELSQEEDRSAS